LTARHVIQLEKKLDDLVNLLNGQKQQEGTEHAQSTTSEPVSAELPISLMQDLEAPNLVQSNADLQAGVESERPDARPLPMLSTPLFSRSHFDFPNQEGAWILLEFRTLMAPQFPFVVIHPDATSESLRNERPMLWKAIVTAASCLKPSRQQAMGWEIMEEFTTRLLLKAEKSLDLLQGLLVHIAWLAALFSTPKPFNFI